MRFVHASPAEAIPVVAEKLIADLQAELQVVWLVCGGSNIEYEVEIMRRLQETVPKLVKNLIVLPMDERYGPAGHENSNFKQMQDAGFMAGNATWYDVLTKNLPLEQTLEYYTHLVEDAFATAESVIGLFGLGSDAHTAGVLPESPAAVDDAATVIGYDSPPFVRITLSPHELIKTNTAYVLAYGNAKKNALERLRDNAESLATLPSSLFYEIPEVTIYNDQIESEGQR